MEYVLAVRANHSLSVNSGRSVTAAPAARLILRDGWHRMRTGHGSKGLRHYDWAVLALTRGDTPGAGHSVLRLIAVAQARWKSKRITSSLASAIQR
jgi:hypothetical protein